MPYNSYFPTGYQPYYMPQYQTTQALPQTIPQAAPQASSGLIWVQGESGAKSYLLAPNTTAMLMDSESDQFFIKSTDASGMPRPLRTFKYTEVPQSAEPTKTDPSINDTKYVEKSVYDDFRRHVEDVLSTLTEEKTKKKVTKDE